RVRRAVRAHADRRVLARAAAAPHEPENSRRERSVPAVSLLLFAFAWLVESNSKPLAFQCKRSDTCGCLVPRALAVAVRFRDSRTADDACGCESSHRPLR